MNSVCLDCKAKSQDGILEHFEDCPGSQGEALPIPTDVEGSELEKWQEMSEATKKLVRDNFDIKEGSFNKTQLQKDLTALIHKKVVEELEQVYDNINTGNVYLALGKVKDRIKQLNKQGL